MIINDTIKTQSGLVYRKGIYPIDETFSILGDAIYSRRKTFIDFHGTEIKANSQRYVVFKEKGCTCVKCGLTASYFALEQHEKQDRFHLNLYGVNEQGQEILFTKDHIQPKSKDGASTYVNYQTMCFICNNDKADNIEEI